MNSLEISCPECAALVGQPCFDAENRTHARRYEARRDRARRCACGTLHDPKLDPEFNTLPGGVLVAILRNGERGDYSFARVCRVCGITYAQPKETTDE